MDIGEVDLRGFHLAISGSSYRADQDNEYAVLLRNRSDAPIYEARGTLSIHIGSVGTGTGSVWTWTGTLQPGAAVRVVRKDGRSSGSASGGDVFLSARIDSITFADCTYFPSRSIASGHEQ